VFATLMNPHPELLTVCLRPTSLAAADNRSGLPSRRLSLPECQRNGKIGVAWRARSAATAGQLRDVIR
jgi:hypothetical protein